MASYAPSQAVTDLVEQRRVQFDFEIAFSDERGFKGGDFPSGICGDDDSDEALADCIIRDLRPLTVGSVVVSGKIISEPRRRVS